MQQQRLIWQGDYPVRTDEVDGRGLLTLPALACYLQDAAARHARQMGFSMADLQAQGLTWVLSRLHLRIESGASWGERLGVETWPCGLKGAFALRDFRVKNAAQQTVAKASSRWLIMRMDSRRPVRPPASFRRLVQQRHAPLLESSESLSADFEPQSMRRLTVRPSDLDLNGHVNHVRCLEWMLEAGQGNAPQEVEVEFRGEALLGDVIESRWAKAGANRQQHALLRNPDQRLLAAAASREAPDLR